MDCINDWKVSPTFLKLPPEWDVHLQEQILHIVIFEFLHVFALGTDNSDISCGLKKENVFIAL